VSLEDLRGYPVVVTLFTTWCLRCQAEAPRFVQMHERLRRCGLRMVGVVLDVETSHAVIKTYVDYLGFRFPVALAAPTDLDLVAAFGPTKAVPRTLLLDRDGRIVLDQHSQTDFPGLEQRVRDLLAKRR
jgi:peroxiredoxin